MTAVDFVEGILTVAATKGHRQFRVADARFDRAMAEAYQELRKDHPDALRLEFQVRPHAIHGDSQVVRGAVNAAVGDRRARRLNPSFQMVETTKLCVEPTAADEFLQKLPGGAELYDRLADRFIAAYYEDAQVTVQ